MTPNGMLLDVSISPKKTKSSDFDYIDVVLTFFDMTWGGDLTWPVKELYDLLLCLVFMST